MPTKPILIQNCLFEHSWQLMVGINFAAINLR